MKQLSEREMQNVDDEVGFILGIIHKSDDTELIKLIKAFQAGVAYFHSARTQNNKERLQQWERQVK